MIAIPRGSRPVVRSPVVQVKLSPVVRVYLDRGFGGSVLKPGLR